MNNYYDYYKNEKKVPGIVAIIIVGIIMAVPFVFLKQKTGSHTSFGASNDHSITPTVLNITASSADIFWKTDDKTVDAINFWDQDQKSTLITDTHDLDTKKTARRLHYFSLRNLAPNREYFISIVHDNKVLGSASNPYFSFSTRASSSISTSLPPVYGKVVDGSGTAQVDTLLIATIKNAAPLGGFTKTDGSFLVSLCCLQNKDTKEPMNPSRNEEISIQFENESGIKSHIVAPISQTSPFAQNIVLGKDVEMQNNAPEQNTVVLGESTSSRTEQLSTRQQTTSLTGGNLIIYYPKDSAVIPGSRPLIKGLSLARSIIKISFPIEKRSFEVTANSDGIFEFAPTFNLKPGSQTVIVQSTDQNGKLVSASRLFTIPKSGEAVLGEATPSGTLTPTLEPTISPSLSPTVEPTLAVTLTPTPTLLPTGIDFGLFSMMSAALILLGGGLILIF